MASERKGKVQTVRGLIDPLELGKTSAHEHLFINAEALFVPAFRDVEKIRNLPFKMENVGTIREFHNSNDENLRLDDYAAVVDEMHEFRRNGGGTVVDCTIIGLGPQISWLKEISEATDVHIVAGSGFYFDTSLSADYKRRMGVEEKSSLIRTQLNEGVDGSGVKCGIIGEIGCSDILTEFEKTSLVAAAEVQAETGAPLYIHPGRHPGSPPEIARILLEAGAQPDKIILGHMDRTMDNADQILEMAHFGTLFAYDLFGIETSYYPIRPMFDMPSDGQRINYVRHLLDNGMRDRVLLAHDIWSKHRLTKYGGHGFSHLLLNVVPRMRMRGFSEEEIHALFVQNPARWLAFSK